MKKNSKKIFKGFDKLPDPNRMPYLDKVTFKRKRNAPRPNLNSQLDSK